MLTRSRLEIFRSGDGEPSQSENPCQRGGGYTLPERALTIQDVYDHACLLTEDQREELCREFYKVNKGTSGGTRVTGRKLSTSPHNEVLPLQLT